MAVVQISKIQLRRGQKHSVSGIPQLSSAEMAWAIDSQELYIGNGSVAEGAPYVGNTRILTEHENLLDLISSYRFDDANSMTSIARSVQGKLDETVSVVDFGAYPDVNTDITPALQLAIDENTHYRKVLIIPNGTYKIQSDLYLPSNTILRGETPNGVVLKLDGGNIRFIFDSEYETFATTVDLSNLIIHQITSSVILTGLKYSAFTDVRFRGDYAINSTPPVLPSDPADVASMGIVHWQNIIGLNVSEIDFNSCTFESNVISIGVLNELRNSSVMRFNDTKFINNFMGTVVKFDLESGDINKHENLWKYNNCKFKNIYSSAVVMDIGSGTLIKDSDFENVANGDSTANSPIAPMVAFGDKLGNNVIDCSSDRMQAANITTNSTIVPIPEVENAEKVSFIDRMSVAIRPSHTFTPFAVLPAETASYELDYILRLGELYRNGTLIITIGNPTVTAEPFISITDESVCSPLALVLPEAIPISHFMFQASLADNDTEPGQETIVLLYRNDLEFTFNNFTPADPSDDSTIPGVEGELTFGVTYYN